MRKVLCLLILPLLAIPVFADDPYTEETLYQLYRANVVEKYAAVVITEAVSGYMMGVISGEQAYTMFENLFSILMLETTQNDEYLQNAATALGVYLENFQERLTREFEEASNEQ